MLPDFDALRAAGEASLYPDKIKITVGMATCGRAAGAEAVYDVLQRRSAQRGLDIILASTGCIGYCQGEPLVDVRLPGAGRVLFRDMDRPRARALIDSLSRGALPAESAWLVIDEEPSLWEGEDAMIAGGGRRFARPPALATTPAYASTPFFARQQKIVLRNCGFIDPTSLAEYSARGGYRGLSRVLTSCGRQQVIDEVVRSGLRGRGGGGFPTGLKWQAAADSRGSEKFIVCNGDEGDPGAYMDRTVLESDPHGVIEGLIIGGYAVDATRGFAYIRDEYPLAVERFIEAIAQAEAQGLLGQNICGSGFNFSIQVVRGAGAFVCGEETALLASIEGGLGEPRPKPPYPAEAGLWGQPTIINNVKTWATVPVILAHGAEWYAAQGSPGNAGTVVFSLVGQIANTGLVEVPLGTKLGTLLQEIGGGATDGRHIKAVQTGGPSGGCLPASLFDLPIDYESMKSVGSIMGSGGMVVLDETACMVDVARYFLDFTRAESCGKCTACREGARHLEQILNRITRGQGRPDDLGLLQEVAEAVKLGSLCGLGQTAPNPVLSTLRYFRDEYEAHVYEYLCPAGKCDMNHAEGAGQHAHADDR